ncbi:MAG: DNA polymerase III subunit gamma/tau [Candidatus Saccharimonadales bacterium]
MGQALYRKYRSKSLKDVLGQEHVTTTLLHALKQGEISHAYLFTGPRGVGKTSVARILAHEINNLPYTDDSMHIDIIEIDAASNRRIDEIRDLRDKVRIAPTSAKYKVYIIDEVHMLTKEAFNALLKTLEEPPEHVVFILATTDVHKLPETIISRTQRFHFRPANVSDLEKLLTDVCKKEKIAIDQGALTLLASHSDGSYRDCLSLLDQARNYGSPITEEIVENLLGLPPLKAIDAIYSLLFSNNPSELVKTLNDYFNQGFQATLIAKQLIDRLRNAIINNEPGADNTDRINLTKKLIETPTSNDPERYLEIVLLDTIKYSKTQQVETKNETISETPIEKAPKTDEKDKALKKSSTKSVAVNAELWDRVLAALKQKHNTLYGIVRMAAASFPSDDTLQLTFSFAFHQKRLNESANRKLLESTINELTGRPIEVEFILDTTNPQNPSSVDTKETPKTDENLTAISNIFSGAELLES